MLFTMDSGIKDLLKEKAFFIIRMVILMMENGSQISAMDSVSILTKLRMRPMKASGKTTFNLEEEQKRGKMDQNMLVTTKKVKSRVMARTPGLMVLCIKEIGLITKLMELANISGKTDENTMVIGKKTTCMDLAYTFIQMDSLMKVCIEMIRKLATASTFGLMVESMKDGGSEVNSMVLEFSRIPRERR